MIRTIFLLGAAALVGLLIVGTSAAQGIGCGPGVGWDGADGDNILFVNATCIKSMAFGSVSAGAHVGFGSGNYDTNSNIVDGSYTAIRANVILMYPIATSEGSAIQPHVFAAPGILSWSEDCDFSDCSDTEIIVDVGGGATLNNQFTAEVFAIAGGSMDYGARFRAMFPIGN